jgi:phosphotriesterase-related protein
VIQTVLGPIDAELLGVTSSHEHVMADASALSRPGIEAAPAASVVTPASLGYLRWSQLGMADNLVLDDRAVAVEELTLAADAGLRSVIEATSLGLGPDHERLPEISRRSGVTIVASYGAYLEAGLPTWYDDLTERGREELFRAALTERIPGVGFRAGMLGIMGTSANLTASERSSLVAAAHAASATGAAVSIRLDPDGRTGLDIVELCRAEGLAPGRILFTNCDEFMDAAYLADLAGAGVVLEMCFGNEAFHYPRVRNPSDLARLDFFVDFLADNPASTWVLGAAVWTKAQLARFGGGGYAHLPARVVPALRHAGVRADRLDDMLISTPALLLDRP